MPTSFRIGDHVSWNPEAGHVSGTIIKIHTSNLNYKGYTHHATKDDPQYEIKSDKTDHIAIHKSSALKKIAKGNNSISFSYSFIKLLYLIIKKFYRKKSVNQKQPHSFLYLF